MRTKYFSVIAVVWVGADVALVLLAAVHADALAATFLAQILRAAVHALWPSSSTFLALVLPSAVHADALAATFLAETLLAAVHAFFINDFLLIVRTFEIKGRAHTGNAWPGYHRVGFPSTPTKSTTTTQGSNNSYYYSSATCILSKRPKSMAKSR